MLIFSILIFCASLKKQTINKYEELKIMAKKSPYITLDPSSFKYFTEGNDRNYSLIVYFKLKGYNVPSFFHYMNDNLQKVAQSSVKQENNHINNVFFAKIIDNDLAFKFCNKFRFTKIPIIVHFPSSGGQSRRDLYDVRWNDGSLDNINFWVRARTASNIIIVKQFSIVKLLTFTAFISFTTLFFYFFGNKLKFINNTYTWAIFSIIFIALMQGGLMYVFISGSPIVGGNKDHIEFISQGMRGQYGLEALIIAGLYCVITYSLIQLNNFSPKKFNLRN
uniref:Magnesium transporter protein 1 (Trinotate prediction) n=1 Tax=Henneguya salminicola TaxID=69463 RepID=A0A6G3MH20_HENSL